MRAQFAIFLIAILLSSVLTSVPLVFNHQNYALAEKGGTEKITICNVPPGNPDNAHPITISEKALDTHLAHVDTLGNCPQLLAEEYLELIGKLNDVGLTLDGIEITQELIDNLRSDLIRLEGIVQELNVLGFEVTITTDRVGQQMIGTISFSDVVTSELLFDIQIPDGTMAILFAIGITDEFLDDGEMLTFDEQTTFLSGGLSIVDSITNFEDDEIASNFVLAVLESFHSNIITTEELSISAAQARGAGTAIREAIKACLKNDLCKEVVFQGSEATVKQLIEGKWITVIISGFVFNDFNNDGFVDDNERTPNESFELFMFDPKILAQVGFTTSNPADGQFAFDEDILFAPLPLIIVNEFLTDLQIDNGWIHSTPDSVSIPVPQQLPSGGTFVDDSTVFGNHQIGSTPPPPPTSGNIYVVELDQDRAQKYSNDGTLLLEWTLPPTALVRNSAPIGITVDSSENVYVTDISDFSRVMKFDSTGTLLTEWDVTGSSHSGAEVNIDAGPSGNIYVVELDQDRAQKYSNDGTLLLEWTLPPTALGRNSAPIGITVDSSENVYVTDISDFSRVMKFDSTGTLLAEWDVTGSSHSGAEVNIDAGPSGNIYVVELDQDRAQKYSNDGTLLLEWTLPPTALGRNSAPIGITVDSSENVYVTDISDFSRVMKFDSTGTLLAEWDVTGSSHSGAEVNIAANIFSTPPPPPTD